MNVFQYIELLRFIQEVLKMDAVFFTWFIIVAVVLFLALSLFFTWKRDKREQVQTQSLVKLRAIEGYAWCFLVVVAALPVGIDAYRRLRR